MLREGQLAGITLTNLRHRIPVAVQHGIGQCRPGMEGSGCLLLAQVPGTGLLRLAMAERPLGQPFRTGFLIPLLLTDLLRQLPGTVSTVEPLTEGQTHIAIQILLIVTDREGHTLVQVAQYRPGLTVPACCDQRLGILPLPFPVTGSGFQQTTFIADRLLGMSQGHVGSGKHLPVTPVKADTRLPGCQSLGQLGIITACYQQPQPGNTGFPIAGRQFQRPLQPLRGLFRLPPAQ